MNRFFTLSFLILLTSTLFAQDTERKSLIISAVPQHILNNAIRFEIDLPQTNHAKWLTIAPQFFYRHEDFGDTFDHPDYDRLIGGEIDIMSRRYLTTNTSEHGEGVYISYGGGYRFLNISITNNLWQKKPEGGLDWYKLHNSEFEIKIHGINAKCLAGYQMDIFDYLLADVYLGFGIRYALTDEPEGNYIRFNRSVNDYAYRGMMLVGGLRVGIGW